MLCHRQGLKRQKTKVDTLKNPNPNKRAWKETRCGCDAELYFKLVDGGMYSVYVFDENHNHHLASTFVKQFLMQNRHLSIAKQNFIMHLGHMRIGATRAFCLVKEMLKNKRDYCKGYVFEYVADEEDTLARLFWADSMSANNDREMFVDVVCFDATYSINNVLVTYQDPAMKAAIAKTFPKSTNRFCMWHIAEKMKAKVGVPLCNLTDFMKNISTAIWSDHIDAADFEEQWKCVIEKYRLEGHNWLSNIYRIRTSWIPVYLKNVHMGKLLRTTSRSESENSFFGRFLHNQMTLVEFYMAFDRGIMDTQKTIDRR
ncbi:hypothetical protein QQ045_029808 [Rhodiola kirilowii]